MTIALIIDFLLNKLDFFTVLNTVALLLLVVGIFRERFTIVDLETWNNVVNYYNEHIEAENDNCGGGVGFKIYSDEEIYDEDEE